MPHAHSIRQWTRVHRETPTVVVDAAWNRPAVHRAGAPGENGDCKSFNGKMRDQLLNGELFYTLKEAQVIIERWRTHDNTVRSHSSLGGQPHAPEALQLAS